MPTSPLALVVLLLVLALLGCKNTPPPAVSADKSASAHLAPTQKSQKTATKLIFVGQKDACACTRERIDKSWEALSTILSKLPDRPHVERIQRDVDTARAAQLNKQASIMVAPGLYLFDETGSLVELVQGELSPEQLQKVLH